MLFNKLSWSHNKCLFLMQLKLYYTITIRDFLVWIENLKEACSISSLYWLNSCRNCGFLIYSLNCCPLVQKMEELSCKT